MNYIWVLWTYTISTGTRAVLAICSAPFEPNYPLTFLDRKDNRMKWVKSTVKTKNLTVDCGDFHIKLERVKQTKAPL